MTDLLAFSWLDYAIFFGMFAVSAIIGLYFGCCAPKNNTTEEYLLGSRAMGVFPVAISLVTSHLSGITLLGIPSEIYMYGTEYAACIFTTCILSSFIIIYVFLPVFYNLKMNTSSYEYLKLRFDGRIRTVALLLYVIGTLLYIPIVIYVPALALNQVSGIEIYKITPIICAICIFYTTVGGLKAVVWTDTVQFSVSLAAMCAVFVMGVYSAGGFSEIWNVSETGERIEFFNMSADPTERTTFWGVAVGMTVSWMMLLGVNPASVQRFMAVPSQKHANSCVIVFSLGTIVTKTICCFFGLIMYAKYRDCDPFSAGKIKQPDQILPYYVLDVARDIPGLPGLFVSGVFSTALSTMSAHLNTLAGTIYEDFIKGRVSATISETRANNIIKATVVVCGIVSVRLVFVIEHLGGVLQVCWIVSGVTTGPLLGLFLLGMFFPSATAKGALYGSASALAAMAAIVAGFQYNYLKKTIKYEYKPLSVAGCASNLTEFTTPSPVEGEGEEEVLFVFRISFYWYAAIGAGIVVIAGLVVSWISREENENKYNKDLYCPLIYRFLPVDSQANYASVMQRNNSTKNKSEVIYDTELSCLKK